MNDICKFYKFSHKIFKERKEKLKDFFHKNISNFQLNLFDCILLFK